MGMSRYSDPQPWTMPWEPGAALANLFNLYPSKGDVTIATAASLPSLLDGPGIANRYGTLTVNAALKAATNRCRMSLLLVENLVMGAAGSISMAARGAAGCSKWANQDIVVPSSINFQGKSSSYKAFVRWLAANGYAIIDPTLFACPLPGMGDVLADYAAWPARGTPMVSASGCGAGGGYTTFQGEGTTAGNPGGAGVTAPGGGGSGASLRYGISPPGGAARVWGGGSGGGCSCNDSGALPVAPDNFGGHGGGTRSSGSTAGAGSGAGNPPGDLDSANTNGAIGSAGTGGVLLIIVRGNITLASGHAFDVSGSMGGRPTASTSYSGGGGSSGGGLFGLFYGGTLSGTVNAVASGGLVATPTGGSTYNTPGGAGGAGSTQVKSFAEMGWS